MAGTTGSCRQADASGWPLGKAVVEFLPGESAIYGAKDAARGAAAFQHPGMALHGPQTGEKDQGIIGVHDQRADAGGVVDKQGLLPGLAAIGGAKDAALSVGSPDMPQNTHDNDVGVVRINHDVGDLAGISKSHEFPGGPGIGREVDPFAGDQIVAGIRLARPHPHQIGIGGGQGNRANGDSSFFFKDGLPGESAILGHEHAASTRPGKIDVGLAWYSYHGSDAPSTYSWTQ